MNAAHELSRLVAAQYRIHRRIQALCSSLPDNLECPLSRAWRHADKAMDALADAEELEIRLARVGREGRAIGLAQLPRDA